MAWSCLLTDVKELGTHLHQILSSFREGAFLNGSSLDSKQPKKASIFSSEFRKQRTKINTTHNNNSNNSNYSNNGNNLNSMSLFLILKCSIISLILTPCLCSEPCNCNYCPLMGSGMVVWIWYKFMGCMPIFQTKLKKKIFYYNLWQLIIY